MHAELGIQGLNELQKNTPRKIGAPEILDCLVSLMEIFYLCIYINGGMDDRAFV